MPRIGKRAASKAGDNKMKNADEIKAIGLAALEVQEKAALEQKHAGEGKPAKELSDIEAGIVGWLIDNAWFMTMEADSARGFWTYKITSGQSVNPYAQGQIAARHLRSLGFKCVVSEGSNGVTLVDVTL